MPELITAEELENMSPNERRSAVLKRLVEPSELPPAVAQRLSARGFELLNDHGLVDLAS